MDDQRKQARARWLLRLGATAGLALAVTSLMAQGGKGPLPAGAVAQVNGVTIRAESYERLLGALAADRRSPLTDEDRHHVLDRLIEEELLVQYAVDLGLVGTDRRVRADLVSAVLSALNASADSYEPDEEAVAAFYRENRDYFARPARVHVRVATVSRNRGAEQARSRAQAIAARRRAGEDLSALATELGDPMLAPPPDGPLPPAKLREYLGPSLLEAAMALGAGEVSDPIETPTGFTVIEMVARSENQAPPQAQIEPLLRAEMKRREGDHLLRQRLDELRAEADVRVAQTLPGQP